MELIKLELFVNNIPIELITGRVQQRCIIHVALSRSDIRLCCRIIKKLER